MINSPMQAIVHHHISDLYKTLKLPLEHELDFTILSLPDIHDEYPFSSPVFRANYFSFVFTKDGLGTYTLDDKTFPFGPLSIYFTNPGHKKSYEVSYLNDAYIISFTENFLMENVHPDIFGEFPFLLAETVPPKKVSQSDFEEFEVLYQQIWTEFKSDSQYKSRILGNLFVVILLKIKEKFWLSYNPIEEGDRNSQIVSSFKQLLEREFQKATSFEGLNPALQVQDYANELHLHPNYLNSVIKSKTGKTVNDWISQRALSVAKYLLKSTSFTAKEIAFRLGFSEATHFSRFFKKHTQVSPGTFRKSFTSQANL